MPDESGIGLPGSDAPADEGTGGGVTDNGNGQDTVSGGGSGSPTQGSGADGGEASWFGSDETHKTLVEKKGWKGVGDALKSYSELETAFHAKGGSATAPAKPDDYKFELPSNVPKDAVNPEFDGWMRNTLHKAGLPQDVANKIYSATVEYAAQAADANGQSATEQLNTKLRDTANALKSEWGNPETPTFKRNVELGDRAMRLLNPDLKSRLTELGVIAKVNGKEMITDPVIFKSFAEVGNRMFAEDELHGAPATNANPFDPDTLDLGAQGQLVRSDKAKARAMILALPQHKRARYNYMLTTLNT